MLRCARLTPRLVPGTGTTGGLAWPLLRNMNCRPAAGAGLMRLEGVLAPGSALVLLHGGWCAARLAGGSSGAGGAGGQVRQCSWQSRRGTAPSSSTSRVDTSLSLGFQPW